MCVCVCVYIERGLAARDHGQHRLPPCMTPIWVSISICSAMVGLPPRLLLPSYMKCHGRTSQSPPPTLNTHNQPPAAGSLVLIRRSAVRGRDCESECVSVCECVSL